MSTVRTIVACNLTCRGISKRATASDAASVDLLRQAWDSNRTRTLAQVEIVDVRPEEHSSTRRGGSEDEGLPLETGQVFRNR